MGNLEVKVITFRISADVSADRQVTQRLPLEVPVGKNDLVVTVGAQSDVQGKRPRSSLADWAERNAESWGERLNSEGWRHLFSARTLRSLTLNGVTVTANSNEGSPCCP
jgi:hypothetical protein